MACLGKIWFFNYGLKCSQPIRWHFLDHKNLWKEFIETLDFLHGYNDQGNIGFDTATFG